MRNLFAIIVTATCLLGACHTAEGTSPLATSGEEQDSAIIYQEKAYQEMFADSLGKAETYAYRAFMLSNDSTMERGTLALLCYIYYREGKQEQLQLLTQTVSPETYINMMDVQWQVEQRKANHDRYLYAITIILLLLVSGIVCYWYIHRMRTFTTLYRQRTESVRYELLHREATLTKSAVLPIDEAKQGIDVLFAIINDQNISQMGKQEEQAALKILPLVDETLSSLLTKVSSPLTPKETFFCIMEYYGKNDKQKARSFCCSEQAIRSTKSRLGKKIDIAILRSE
ncbi:MAG: hypothetical protein IJ633_00630 [Prevotella sp.]|nr:hypothetical protein [Prevotella sp.]